MVDDTPVCPAYQGYIVGHLEKQRLAAVNHDPHYMGAHSLDCGSNDVDVVRLVDRDVGHQTIVVGVADVAVLGVGHQTIAVDVVAVLGVGHQTIVVVVADIADLDIGIDDFVADYIADVVAVVVVDNGCMTFRMVLAYPFE